MVIHGSKMMYLEDKSVNNHPTQIVNHHCLDKGSAPTTIFAINYLDAVM